MGGPGSGGARPFSTIPKMCEYCGEKYTPKGNRSKYCQECAPNRWASGLIRMYGISHKDYMDLLQEQDYTCALSPKKFPAVELVAWEPGKPRVDMCVDHDHITGWVRGILCTSCNARLSGIEDEEWFKLAMQYIADSKEVG